MTDTTRGQSEVVGSLLLAAMFVITISLIGVAVLNTVDAEKRQLTTVSVVVTTESVTVSHDGGEPMAPADLEAAVSFDGRSERYNAADGGVSDPFSANDQWIINTTLPYDETNAGKSVSVMVIAVNTNEVLYTGTENIS